MATLITPPGHSGLTAEARRQVFKDMSRTATVVAADTSTELVDFLAARANHRIWVQRIIVYITTTASQSMTFQDDAVTPLIIATVPSSPGDETRWDFDFGPVGVALGENVNLDIVLSAAGLAGHVQIYAYQAPSSVFAATAAASGQ